MAILDDVKKTLRVTSTAMDDEITDLIDACKIDLNIAGVDSVSENDPLIKRAITTYCKAYFGYDNPDADRFIKAYDALKIHLSVSVDYHLYEVTE